MAGKNSFFVGIYLPTKKDVRGREIPVTSGGVWSLDIARYEGGDMKETKINYVPEYKLMALVEKAPSLSANWQIANASRISELRLEEFREEFDREEIALPFSSSSFPEMSLEQAQKEQEEKGAVKKGEYQFSRAVSDLYLSKSKGLRLRGEDPEGFFKKTQNFLSWAKSRLEYALETQDWLRLRRTTEEVARTGHQPPREFGVRSASLLEINFVCLDEAYLTLSGFSADEVSSFIRKYGSRSFQNDELGKEICTKFVKSLLDFFLKAENDILQALMEEI